MNDYEDIINLPHWNPTGRRRMSMEARAAQFAPFAAQKEGESNDKQETPDCQPFVDTTTEEC